MTDTFPGMIPLGYFIVRKSGKKPRPLWITPDYLTVAGCFCEGVIPGIESVPFDDGKKEENRREWDLPSREARRLYDAVRNNCMQINYDLFHNFLDCGTPRRICGEFFAGREDVLVIGLGTNDVCFLESPGIGKVSPLPGNAVPLGWDLYGFGDYAVAEGPLPPMDYHAHGRIGELAGLRCTFCCCDSNGALPKRLGIQLNSHGLYPDAQSATRAAGIVNSERLGEPCHYLPFALFACPAAGR